MRVVLLIVRITVGCNTEWAKLRNTDLQVVGISDSHAKVVIESMVIKDIIIRNEKTKAYKLSPTYFDKLLKVKEPQLEKLAKIIGRHLPKTSQKGKVNVPEMGGTNLPKEEENTYQIGKSYFLPKREDSGSDEAGFQTAKDILKRRLNISDR